MSGFGHSAALALASASAAMEPMTPIYNTTLLVIGAWLLCYRPVLRIPGCRAAVEAVTTVACGCSLALLAPLLPLVGVGIGAPFLAVIGVALSFCHAATTALVVALALGAGVSGMAWQLWLCAASHQAYFVHVLLLSLVLLVFSVLFVCTPGCAGSGSLVMALLPTLGALLTVMGTSALVGGMTPAGLLAEAPCPASSGFFARGLGWPRTPWECLAAWLGMTALGVCMQLMLSRIAKSSVDAEAATGPGGDLVASLLPGARTDGPPGMPKPGQGDDRYGILTKAIFADEGADMSHLTENEKKIVEVCRKDEFERDRILWGGGLI